MKYDIHILKRNVRLCSNVKKLIKRTAVIINELANTYSKSREILHVHDTDMYLFTLFKASCTPLHH